MAMWTRPTSSSRGRRTHWSRCRIRRNRGTTAPDGGDNDSQRRDTNDEGLSAGSEDDEAHSGKELDHVLLERLRDVVSS